MIRTTAITLSALLLMSCGDIEVAGSGEPIRPTRDDKTFKMTIEVVPENRITTLCSNLGVKYDANGCAAFKVDSKECTIYVMEPRHADDVERFAIIGHETWHCRFGQWHQ